MVRPSWADDLVAVPAMSSHQRLRPRRRLAQGARHRDRRHRRDPRPSGKAGLGEIDVPVTFGEVTFHPGDMLFSDDDGVVVLRVSD